MISALFSYEFVDGGVDYDSLEQIHRCDIHDWVSALESAGLFDDAVVAEIEQAWRSNPKLLLDLLLAEADEMTMRRCLITWAALDRIAPLAQIG
ncbi:hypothetical protein FOY51_12035 [Antrihabitans cavernicola]|uniref:Uncharacterized protein n=2 Tax=Antrihabitans cavernicola TaxID=2495913 RepID=A0A5A7SDF3_9NOCA|nr:hypothetical protein FOY51_12035 [Spelaeibacter cavernicola]